MDSNTLAATPPFGTTPVAPVSDALHDATLDLLITEDAGAIAGKALSAAGRGAFKTAGLAYIRLLMSLPDLLGLFTSLPMSSWLSSI